MPKTGEVLNMFNPFGLCSIKMCLKQGKRSICSICSMFWGKPSIEQIEHIEHFPCFKHILIEHKPKGLNILSISLVLASF